MNVLIASEAPLSPNLLRCGQQADLPGPLELHAGDLRLLYDGGGLRSICLGKHELVRRIYAAVRDRDLGHGTRGPFGCPDRAGCGPLPHLLFRRTPAGRGPFRLAGRYLGRPGTAGAITVSFSMQGQALSSFYKNRIGLCVLLPIRLAGAACSLEHAGGGSEQLHSRSTSTPASPRPPSATCPACALKPGEAQVTLTLDGDAFELEDQRNWTDASFKVYSTPLRLPYPVEIQAGTQVSQSVSLQSSPRPGIAGGRTPGPPGPWSCRLQAKAVFPFPGSVWAAPATTRTWASPRSPACACCTSTTCASTFSWRTPGILTASAAPLTTASALSVGLHLGLHFSGEAELAAFAREHAPLLQDRQSVKLWLVYPEPERYHGGAPLREALALAQKYLSGLSTARGAFALGTDHDLIFLLRNPPPAGELSAVTFAINPQVHTFDDASVMETLEAQAPALQRARQLAGATPVMVSPITLKPRRNPYASPASSSGQNQPLGELPPQVDARQASLFTAAWTVGSLRALALGGAQSLTYYETTGWRGVMETASGSPMPELFHSIPGSVFPVYHVFAALAGFRGAKPWR